MIKLVSIISFNHRVKLIAFAISLWESLPDSDKVADDTFSWKTNR